MQAETKSTGITSGPELNTRRNFQRISLAIAGLVLAVAYSAVVGLAAHAHEPWADEAQSWLIARDANLVDIWTKLVRLEGSPGLWHSLLHVLISLGMPYSGLNYVSGALGLAASVVLFCFSPFPLAIRSLLPFTYFLCFQYAVVARNYSLAPVLLFSAAAAYRAKRNGLLLSLLILLACVSAQAFLLSVGFAVAIALEMGTHQWTKASSERRKNALIAAVAYLAALVLVVLAVWPNDQTVFFISPNWSIDNFIGVSRYAFQQAFGDGYWPVWLIALTIPSLWRSPGLLFFLLSAASLCIFGSVVYSNVWHHGYLVLAWLTAIWISFAPERRNYLALAGLSLFILLQCSWTWNGFRYDRKNAYSGSRDMARLLHTKFSEGVKVFGIGFPTVGVQPYFPSNIYANYATRKSFWVWSKSNATNDAAEHLGTEHPDLVLLGYAGDSDRRLWTHLITQSGYHQIAQTEGNLFWRTGAFQPENFQLFSPGPQVSDTVLLNKLMLSEPAGEVQLLSGVTGPPTPEGRQLASGGQVAIQRPSLGTGHSGARVEMKFVVSKEQFGRSGPMNLTVYVGGRRLHPMKIKSAGQYSYSSNVASSDLFWAVVPVAFEFRRAGLFAPALTQDSVATASEIGLFAQ